MLKIIFTWLSNRSFIFIFIIFLLIIYLTITIYLSIYLIYTRTRPSVDSMIIAGEVKRGSNIIVPILCHYSSRVIQWGVGAPERLSNIRIDKIWMGKEVKNTLHPLDDKLLNYYSVASKGTLKRLSNITIDKIWNGK